MSAGLCRWGILGTASIARKNWKAIRNSGNGTLTAVASRDAGRARAFVAACQSAVPFDPAPRAVGGYGELLAREDIDAVYVPLPTALRQEWVIRAAESGKHVLCEKPCGVSASELASMLEACHRHQRQFMDGVMFMHSRRLAALRQVLDGDDGIGAVRRIVAQFSFAAPSGWVESNIRTDSRLEPLGCLGDLGWYCLRLALWVMQWQLPRSVTGRLLREQARPDSPATVPTEFAGELIFADNVSASFYCSFLAENQQWASVSGTEGYLHLRDFVLPYRGQEIALDVTRARFVTQGCDFHMEDHTRRVPVAEDDAGTPSAQESNMFRCFADRVLEGRPDPQWGQIALQTQQVLDACLRSARAGCEPVTPVPGSGSRPLLDR